jgi:nucleoside-diphosphate-sugar epimerase
MADRVLLTGISGFLGGHVALQLLNAGFAVRGSVRSLDKADKVRTSLAKAGADISSLEFVALDLLDDAGWDEAARDCRYLQHVASPFVITLPKDKNELIRPAVEGTRRALSAAMANGVERMVLTSSIAAIVYGHIDHSRPFTESDWTDVDAPGVPAYPQSKTLAEREAWRLVDAAGRRNDLAVINPGVIYGPLIDEDAGTSATIIQRLLRGGMPGAPSMSFTVVDVRDVAAAHIAAMINPAAGGQRFIVGATQMSIMEVSAALRPAFPQYAGKLPRFELPNWAVWLVGLVDSSVSNNIKELGTVKLVDTSRARALLGRPFIPGADAAIATGQSLIEHGLI